ncbi:MAG: site-specific DNA-methyltransferase, partial [Chloroflexi bacterium]|nr:site-specific DNA-methyltransferase [Chloroflexota bacterium]
HGEEFLPAGYVDLTPDEERKVLLTLDPLAAMAAADKEKLDGLLRSVSTESQAVQAMLAEIAEKEGIRLGRELPAPEAQIDKAAELQEKWQVTTGSVWEAGEQRLICGDCTDRATVERLMRGEKAEICVTDPPYGVQYEPEWRRIRGVSNTILSIGKVINDDKSDWSVAIALVEAPIVYIWHAALHSAVVFEGLLDKGYEIRNQIIWYKNIFALSRGDYHWQHEPCWYAVRKGFAHKWSGDRNQTTVWDIKPLHSYTSEEEHSGHPTQKPLECMERPIRNHDCNIIVDPFLGSGTTLVACARLGRRGRGVEIVPAYCAASLQRLADMGLEVKRVEDGHSITSPP